MIAVFSNGLPYFFPFREELANKHDLIGSILGTKRSDHEEPPHRGGRREEEEAAQILVQQESLKITRNSQEYMNLINRTQVVNTELSGNLNTSNNQAPITIGDRTVSALDSEKLSLLAK